jgi:cell division protein FtsW
MTRFFARKSASILCLSAAGLLTIGMVMLFSASAYARDGHGDTLFFLRKQSVWLVLGLMAATFAALVDYQIWRRLWLPLWILSLVLLALCFVPGIGMKLNGSWRWVRLGPMSFQPSEVAKFAAVLFAAHWFARIEGRQREFLRGIVVPVLVVGPLMALILMEADLGTTALMGFTLVGMMFIAGTNLLWLSPLGLGAMGGILYIATRMPERMGRLVAFLYPEQHRDGAGFQQFQGLVAFGSGGFEGVGLGNGRQKMHYLPYAHTDFILPMVGEELGLRATLAIAFGFLLFVAAGCAIAMHARDRFGSLLAAGLTMCIASQAAINIAVTTCLLPNKGMPLPFISAGGSNLCLCLFALGVMVSIHRASPVFRGERELKDTPRPVPAVPAAPRPA